MSIYCSTFETAVYPYRGSHVMPSRKDERCAEIGLAYPAAHIPTALERARGIDYVDKREWGTPGHPWLRLDIYGGDDYRAVVLHEKQARELRDWLDGWLAEPKVKRTG